MTTILNSHVKVDSLQLELMNPAELLTVTIIANATTSVQSIAEYYRNKGFKVDQRKIDVRLTGTVEQLQQIFQTQFHYHSWRNSRYYSNDSDITVPSELDIVGVLGLDNFPIFKPHCSKADSCCDTYHSSVRPMSVPIRHFDSNSFIQPNAAASSFLPTQVASIYSFPGNRGAGQTIGIIELGGMFSQTDLNTYFSHFSLGTAPTVSVHLVDGATQVNDDATFEVALDVDVIAAIVPDATIQIYFGPNSMVGFYNAIYEAGQNNDIVSISWGLDEAAFLSASGFVNSYQSLFNSLGVTILVSSGDNGSTGLTGSGFHVSFPASVPSCLSCGGTTLSYDLGSNTFLGETAWSGSGGGYSIFYSRPSYQDGIVSSSKRGQPDICGNANPSTGYIVRNGGYYVIGGTSAVSPLWAALIAQINYITGTPMGICNQTLYSLSSAVYRDVTSGNNGGFTASTGWDAVTGLGAPHGDLILAAIRGSSLTISSVSPSNGSTDGGTTITINGSGFNTVTGVTFGGTAGTSLTIINDGRLTVVSPAHSAGSIDLAVIGSSTVTRTFTFVADLTPTISSISPSSSIAKSRRTNCSISGTNLELVSRVTFGGLPATVIAQSSTLIRVRVPYRTTTGTVTVLLTGSGGSVSTTFTYSGPIKIRSIRPPTGDHAGGTRVIVRGIGLNQVTAVSLGGTTVDSSISSSQISFVTPAHDAGRVSLRLITDGSSYIKSNAFRYTNISPTISRFYPNSGSTNGGTIVTVIGSNLHRIKRVNFNGSTGRIIRKRRNYLQVKTSPLSAGEVPVTFVSSVGPSLTETFTFT